MDFELPDDEEGVLEALEKTDLDCAKRQDSSQTCSERLGTVSLRTVAELPLPPPAGLDVDSVGSVDPSFILIHIATASMRTATIPHPMRSIRCCF